MESLLSRLVVIIEFLVELNTNKDFNEWAKSWMEGPTTIESNEQTVRFSSKLVKQVIDFQLKNPNVFDYTYIVEMATATTLSIHYFLIINEKGMNLEEQKKELEKLITHLESHIELKKYISKELNTAGLSNSDLIN